MKTIAQFRIFKEGDIFTAEGLDLAIVTEADNLDSLVKKISEAVELYFEGENVTDFDFAKKPSVLINYELPNYA